MPVVRPEHIAGNRDGGELAAAQFLDEIAGDQRTLQLGEELLGARRVDCEIAVEAAVGSTLADQRPQQCQVSDVGGLEHLRRPDVNTPPT